MCFDLWQILGRILLRIHPPPPPLLSRKQLRVEGATEVYDEGVGAEVSSMLIDQIRGASLDVRAPQFFDNCIVFWARRLVEL